MCSRRPWSTARLSLAAAAAFGLAACLPDGATAPSSGTSSDATAHLNQVVGIMQANSINRLTINWTAFRDTVFATAKDAKSIPETFPAILVALRMLGDGHSQYQIAGGGTLFVPTRTCVFSATSAPALPSNIGYVRVGSFNGGGTAATTFAEGIQNAIRLQDKADLIGWIVDLRGNGGGNMWPMIAGLGPILGETLLGHFVDPTGVVQTWRYQTGASFLNGVPLVGVASPYRLLRENPRVAVLSDNGIASSGEATFIAFIGRPDTRSFGASTCGASTGNGGFPMSNGDLLILTTVVMADRNLKKYGASIPPDYIAMSNADAVATAIDWVQTGTGAARF